MSSSSSSGGVVCTADADHGSPTLQSPIAQDVVGAVYFSASIDGGEDYVVLALYPGYGAFAGGTVTTGTFELTGEDLNYATCGICVLLSTEYDADTGSFLDDYFATGGSVTLNSVEGNLTGSLSNVTFQQVTIDPDTYESSPHPSGCQSGITATSFDAPIQQ
ncbi:MAG: hypothetical protein AB2A00_12535 [Myxococcota bacterium]